MINLPIMSVKKTKALVVFSGVQDSTTCLALALEQFPDAVETLTFDYGQRHVVELEQAEKIAKLAGVPHSVIDLSFMGQLTENALTRDTIKIEHKAGQLPSTFVPGRNHIFLSVAAIMAYQKNIEHIFTGVCQTDFSGYPDCRDAFIKSLNHSLNLAMETTFTLHTPLMWMTKKETISDMQRLGKLSWYAETHTCYKGARPACGDCPACVLRVKGFNDAGLTDPLDYR